MRSCLGHIRLLLHIPVSPRTTNLCPDGILRRAVIRIFDITLLRLFPDHNQKRI